MTRTYTTRTPQAVTPEQSRLIAMAAEVQARLTTTPNTDSTYSRLVRDRREAVQAARAKGATLQAIADGLGIARQNVAKILTKVARDA
jgi:DNA invertase Pin-like site-specific DNA recombinase